MDPYYTLPQVSNSDLSRLKGLLNPSFLNGNDPYNAYRLGTLVDAVITEPEKIDYYRLRIEDYQYTREEFEMAHGMKKSFEADPFCKEMLLHAMCQKVSIRHNHEMEYRGVKFYLDTRCKWDLFQPHVGWGGDIKSTVATTQKAFEAAIDLFDWDRSRAWYMDIEKAPNDVIIGISKIKPYRIFKVPITTNSEIYKQGKEKYLELAFKYNLLFTDFSNN